jgi:TolB-like protein/DNA-binding winged helix-turn-helix (wHTH) protein/Tfp pilus assembly protein PilF
MTDQSATSYIFGSFRLHLDERTLTRDGQFLDLTPKEFDTLQVLVEARGRLVSKEDLIRRVWPHSYVGDGSLARNISVLRKLLGEDAIGTVSRRGYRLAIPVALGLEPSISSVPAPRAEPEQTHTGSLAQSVDVQKAPAEQSGRSSKEVFWLALRGHSRPVTYAAVTAVFLFIVVIFNRASITHAKVNPLQGPVRIAVLPFANYTGNPQDDYLCDGMTEATISELSRLKPNQLSVIARTSAMKFKKTDRTIPQIAAELKADYILESSVRGSSDRMRITTQLVRGSDASHVWTGEYERSAQNLLDLQQDVSIAVADEIRLTVDASVRKRLQDVHAVDPEAYQDYLMGRFHWNTRNRDGLFKSLEDFQRAIVRDPQYARAYAGLADAYLVLGGGYLPDIEAYNKARAAALKALELDNTLSDAYTSLAYEEFVNERDMNAADENYQRALTLDPNNANAHHWYALYLSAMKRPDEAIEQIGRALELDPLAIGIRYNAGSIYLAAGRSDEAEVFAKRAIELDPNCAPAHGTLALIYEAQQQYTAAMREFETAQKLRAGYSPYAVEVAHMYVLEGNRQRARTLLASLLSDAGWAKVAPYTFALTYAALGEKDRAFLWLKRCAEDHSCTALEFNRRELDPLRSDRRFSQIVR